MPQYLKRQEKYSGHINACELHQGRLQIVCSGAKFGRQQMATLYQTCTSLSQSAGELTMSGDLVRLSHTSDALWADLARGLENRPFEWSMRGGQTIGDT